MKNINIVPLLKSRGFTTALVGIGGVGLGGFGGYIYAKKKLEPIYAERASKEIEEAREHYRVIRKMDEEFKTPEQMVKEKYGESVQGLDYDQADKSDEVPEVVIRKDQDGKLYTDYSTMSTKNVPPVPEAKTVDDVRAPAEQVVAEDTTAVIPETKAEEKPKTTRNTFHQVSPRDNSDWDWAEQMEMRENFPNIPYIITHEEFLENERELLQEELTYYEGDDTLTEANDQIIPSPETTLGGNFAMSFGVQSNDHDVVYIRDEVQSVEYEVRRVKGTYVEHVLGVPNPDDEETSMRHSDRRGVPKFRMHDG
jgi:hypothetical protein